MSATQTLCDVLSYLSSDTGCPYSDEACRACPLPPAMEPSDGSCQEAFARLLRAARSEPWEGTARDYGRRGEYCSLCESGLPDGARECPTCGAAIREGGADVSVSAYDLLPQEEREAIAWVREHGGIESVKKLLDWVVGHCSTKQQLDFDFWLSGRVMHELGFDEDMADRYEVERRLLARLMPDGMEWPTVDGEPVVIGERLIGYGSGDDGYEVVGVRPTCGWVLVKLCDHIHRDGGPVILEWDASKCRRPVPKALDADGNRIEPAMDVWWVCEDDERGVLAEKLHVESIGEDGLVECSPYNGGTWVYLEPSELYVNRPVLAADGKPLREGETVWRDDGEMLEVLYLRPDGLVDCCGEIERPERLTHERPVLDADGKPLREGETVWGTGREEHEYVVLGQPGLGGGAGRFKVACHDVTDDVDCDCDPDLLTHERPDSWERLEDDATMAPWAYVREYGLDCEDFPQAEAMAHASDVEYVPGTSKVKPLRTDEECAEWTDKLAEQLAERGARRDG